MKGQHRLDLIVAYLKNHTLVTVEQLVEAVDASPATIRRDLIKLDEQGVISRVMAAWRCGVLNPPSPPPMKNNCDRPLKNGRSHALPHRWSMLAMPSCWMPVRQ